ncbi:radical SAM protein [Akkermansia glycaniphila]|uniref:radical SAM protein n=1 Tax=Akkermansia glycaniphila TaxID=1679444 RepID=UPI001C037636|nr:radical SAM protein [Akkermansia glycaniphila]MBT9450337.1 radical SAM protein [Akkermansia glycaniphila]
MRPSFENIDLNERPFLVFWEVTRACALACKHCRATAQPHADPQELSTEEALKLIDAIAVLRPPMLVLTGGDPMMRRDIFDLIRHAAGKGLRVALSPAATARLIHTDFMKLKEAGVQSMSLSLDGATRETHDAFRGVPDTYVRTLQAARMAQEAGMHLQINTTITRSTLGEVDAFLELMKELKPSMWSVFLLVPTGRASLDELPSAEEVEAVWHRLEELSVDVEFGVKTTEGHHYRRVALQEAKRKGAKPARHAVPTRDGKGIVFISHTGEIQPSGFLPMTAGNVRQDELAEVYRSHPLFVKLRDDDALEGKCGRCEYRRICGGSRARAYGMTGNAFASDPLCSYQPR